MRTSNADTSAKSTSGGVKTIASLQKGLHAFRLIEAASAASFTDLFIQTGWPKANLARVLKTLQQERWIQRSPDTGRYSVNRTSMLSQERAEWVERLSHLAAGPREALQTCVPWPTDLGVRDGAAMLSVDGPYSRNSLSANFRVLGSRPSMLRSSLGRCYLSFCPDKEREEILAALCKSRLPADQEGSDPAEVQRWIQQVRSQGYATRNARHTSVDSPEHFGALAVPVMVQNQIAASLCVVWISAVVSEDHMIQNYLAPLLQAAGQISGKLHQSLLTNSGP